MSISKVQCPSSEKVTQEYSYNPDPAHVCRCSGNRPKSKFSFLLGVQTLRREPAWLDRIVLRASRPPRIKDILQLNPDDTSLISSATAGRRFFGEGHSCSFPQSGSNKRGYSNDPKILKRPQKGQVAINSWTRRLHIFIFYLTESSSR